MKVIPSARFSTYHPRNKTTWSPGLAYYCYFNEHNLETAKLWRAAIRNSLEKGVRQYCTAGDNVKAR